MYDEEIDENVPLVLFDPIHTWNKKEITNFTIKNMHVKIFDKGSKIYQTPSLEEIKEHATNSLSEIWTELRRFSNPSKYYVNMSYRLWDIKNRLIEKHRL